MPVFVTPTYKDKLPPGMVSPGNIDLGKRPDIKNTDGSHSTVFSMGVNIDGKELLIPGVGDGKTYPLRKLSVKEATDQYRKTGMNLGTFADPKSSDSYAQTLHEDQARGNTSMPDWEALAKKHGGVTAAPVDYDAIAQRHGGVVNGQPVKTTPTDTIGPDTRGPVEHWFSDFQNDIKTGSGFTAPGRFLHKVGLQPTGTGEQKNAGDLFGGALIGPAEVGEGVAALTNGGNTKKTVQNVNKLARGIGHTLAPAAAVTAPELIAPMAATYGPVQAGIEKTADALGADPDTSELIGNAAMLGEPLAKRLAGPVGRFAARHAPAIGTTVGLGAAAAEIGQGHASPQSVIIGMLGAHPAGKLATKAVEAGGRTASGLSSTPLLPHEVGLTPGSYSQEPIPDVTPDQLANHMGMKLPVPAEPKLLESGPITMPPPAESPEPLIRTPQAQVVRGKGGRMTKQFLTGESETDDKPRMGSQAPLLPGLGDSQAPPPLNTSTAAQPTTEFKNNGIIPPPNGSVPTNTAPVASAPQTRPLISIQDSEVVPSNPATGQQSVTLPETKSGPQLVSSPTMEAGLQAYKEGQRQGAANNPILSDTEIRANFGKVNGPQPVEGPPRRTDGAAAPKKSGDLIDFPEPAPLTKESESPIINTGQDMPKSPDMSRRDFLKGAAKTAGAASMPKKLIDTIAGPEATAKVADAAAGQTNGTWVEGLHRLWDRLDLGGDDDVDYNGGGLYRLGEALKAYASENKPEGKFNVSHQDLENHFEGDDLLDEGPGGTSRYFADSLSPRVKDLLSDSGIEFTPEGISVADPSKIGRMSSIADAVSGSYDPSFIESEAFSKAGSEIEPLIQAREKLGWSSPSAAEQWENYKNSDDYKKRFGEKPAESKISEAAGEDDILPGDFSLNTPARLYHGSGENLINTGIHARDTTDLFDAETGDPNSDGSTKHKGVYLTLDPSHADDYAQHGADNGPDIPGRHQQGTVHTVDLPRGSSMRVDPYDRQFGGDPHPTSLVDVKSLGIQKPGMYSDDSVLHRGDIPSGAVNTQHDLIDTHGIQQDMRENLDRGQQNAEDLRMKAAYKGSKPGYNPDLPGEDRNTDLMPWARTPWGKEPVKSDTNDVLPGDFSLNTPQRLYHGSSAEDLIHTGLKATREPISKANQTNNDGPTVYLTPDRSAASAYGKVHTVDLPRGSSMRAGQGEETLGPDASELIHRGDISPDLISIDRRTDTSRRKMIADMSPEEMKKELLTSDKTGLPNRRAFEEAQTKSGAATVGMSDADGLKALNDKFGYEAGDQLLKAKAEALKEAGLDSYHDKGDEFLHRGDSPEDLQAKLDKARDIFRNRVIEVQMKDGTTRQFKGADFSFGTGGNLEQAEAGLKEHKADRETRGERARGELRGITEVGPDSSQGDKSPAKGELISMSGKAPKGQEEMGTVISVKPGPEGSDYDRITMKTPGGTQSVTRLPKGKYSEGDVIRAKRLSFSDVDPDDLFGFTKPKAAEPPGPQLVKPPDQPSHFDTWFEDFKEALKQKTGVDHGSPEYFSRKMYTPADWLESQFKNNSSPESVADYVKKNSKPAPEPIPIKAEPKMSEGNDWNKILSEGLDKAKRGEKNPFSGADEFEGDLFNSAYEYLTEKLGEDPDRVDTLDPHLLYQEAATKGWNPAEGVQPSLDLIHETFGNKKASDKPKKPDSIN